MEESTVVLESELSRRITFALQSPEFGSKYQPSAALQANQQRASRLTAESIQEDRYRMQEQAIQIKPLKLLSKPTLQPMVNQHRTGLTIVMLQDFEHYYQGSREALIGYEHMIHYRSSDFATAGRATIFNRLFLAGLHPDLHRQALGEMSREDKDKSVSFERLVTELREYLIAKTIGNDFAEFCKKHKQPEGWTVDTHIANLQPALPYISPDLASNIMMGRKALFHTFRTNIQHELVDQRLINLEILQDYRELFDHARKVESTLEQRG